MDKEYPLVLESVNEGNGSQYFIINTEKESFTDDEDFGYTFDDGEEIKFPEDEIYFEQTQYQNTSENVSSGFRQLNDLGDYDFEVESPEDYDPEKIFESKIFSSKNNFDDNKLERKIPENLPIRSPGETRNFKKIIRGNVVEEILKTIDITKLSAGRCKPGRKNIYSVDELKKIAKSLGIRVSNKKKEELKSEILKIYNAYKE